MAQVVCGQTLPQAPQLDDEVFRFAHVLPHTEAFAAQVLPKSWGARLQSAAVLLSASSTLRCSTSAAVSEGLGVLTPDQVVPVGGAVTEGPVRTKSTPLGNFELPINPIALALVSGATYIARSFSGDKQQLVPLIQGAILHQGAAFIDILSPCVAFNNHDGSTKSYDYVREHNEAVNFLDVIRFREEITAEYAPGALQEVQQHDGSILRLRKLHENYDPTDRIAAMNHLQESRANHEIATGLLYVDGDATDLHAAANTVDLPLNLLDDKALIPGSSALAKLNAALR